MNVASSRVFLRFRRAAALTVVSAAGLSGVSCVTYPPPGRDNVFIEESGRPRYGYGGVESPNARPDNRQTPPRSPQPSERKKPAPEIRRDPNNTTVDVTPPPPKKDRKADGPSSQDTAPPPETQETPPPPKEKPAPVREDLPFGQPVIGRPGFVYSPYAPTKLVEVADTPSGTRVECPYTKKHFRVP